MEQSSYAPAHTADPSAPRVIAPTVINTTVPAEPQEEEVEGQLTIDMYHTPDTLVVRSTIAGVAPEDVSVTLDGETLTIRGERKRSETVEQQDYYYQECYWGSFSRSVTVPMEVDPAKVRAEIKNGILTVTLPRIRSARPRRIKVTG